MFTTAAKRGKKASRPGTVTKGGDHSPSNMYGAAEFGGGRPDSSRRFSGVYGKNAKARNEADIETGAETRRTGRMANWMKGGSY